MATKSDTRAFRNALGSFPTGVTVVIAGGADRHPMGMTINSFTSVSLDPPLILWCIHRGSQRFDTFARADVYTVSVLDATHEAVSSRLARPGEHRLDGIPLVTEFEAPALADALAVFECRREAMFEGGDHAVLLGRVVRFGYRLAGAPLVFFRGRYLSLVSSGEEHEEKTPDQLREFTAST